MDTSKMTSFLLLQDLDCCLPGQSSNKLREPCLFCRTYLVDPYPLPSDQQGQGPRLGMWGCSCLGDRGTDRSLQSIACTQGRRSLMHERSGHQAHNCLVSVHFSMAGHRVID